VIVSTRITVGVEPVKIVPSQNMPVAVQLLNAGSEVVRIGGDANVSPTAAFGLPRLPESPNVARNNFEFTLNPGEEIWAVVAANTSDLNVWYQVK
jgi:hypothetical protein